jgi:NADPH-dependent 2,4-dienoyl-CoA reductase/sulfur reductase-like enzyme
VGAEERPPYDRPPLSKRFLAWDAPTAVTPFRTEAEMRDELGVELMLGAAADGLDTVAREVTVAGTRVPYDALVIGCGAAPRGLPGADGTSGVHSLRTAEDAVAVRAALDAGARTVVVGAGFIGSEVASAARARGLPVTVVESLDVPLARAVGTEAGQVCAQLHRDAGTDLRTGTSVTGIETTDGRVSGVRLDDGEVVRADLVVLGTGVAPATGWLRGSGVGLHEDDGGILCDATLATGASGVYAAGDVAHVPHWLFDGDLMRLEHWTNAAEQGAAAARNALAPASARPAVSVPYFWSDWYSHRIQLVGTSRADEVAVVDPRPRRFLALYRRDDRVVGAFTVNRARDIMKLRRRVSDRSPWGDALAFAGDRRS